MESLLKEYPNVLVLRVRMPIVADLTYPRNFITKIIKYEKARSPPASRSLPSLPLPTTSQPCSALSYYGL